MHRVKCLYCKEYFDADKEEFVKPQANRYAHKKCAENPPQLPVKEKSRSVKCFYCGKSFEIKDSEEGVVWGHPPYQSRRYAHQTCLDNRTQEQREQEEAEHEIYEYLKRLYNIPEDQHLPQKIYLQLSKYISEYHYNYRAMLRTLKYAYEVKHLIPQEDNMGIGIIPHMYDNARTYYYNQWLLSLKNQEKDIKDYIPKVIEVTIKEPERKPKRRRVFMFLDEEVEDE